MTEIIIKINVKIQLGINYDHNKHNIALYSPRTDHFGFYAKNAGVCVVIK